MSRLNYRTLERLVEPKRLDAGYFITFEANLDKSPVYKGVYPVLANVGYVRKNRSIDKDNARRRDYTFNYPCRVDYNVNWRCFMVTSSREQRLLTFDSKNIAHALQSNLTLFLGT